MGNYTRLTIDVRLQPLLPVVVYDVLFYLTSDPVHDQLAREFTMMGWNQQAPPIDHPFFKCERWDHVFANSCAYLPVDRPTFGREWYYYRLKGSGCTKAYDDEYAKFLNWLTPYMIEEAVPQMVAYTEYDTNKHPRVEYTLTNQRQLTWEVIR